MNVPKETKNEKKPFKDADQKVVKVNANVATADLAIFDYSSK